jgi:hypothetical protein
MSEEKEEVLLEKVREIEKAKQAKENPEDKNNTASILNEKRELSEPVHDDEAKRQMSRRSRRTFLIGEATALVGIFGWRWMSDESKDAILKRTFRFNEKISQTFFGQDDLAPEFSRELAGARVNGMIGLNNDFDAASWQLRVGGLANRSDDLILTLDDIKALPHVEMTTELKCIEGWSVIVNWAGARFSDFAAKFPPQFTKYVSLVTPDEEYFVGWECRAFCIRKRCLSMK